MGGAGDIAIGAIGAAGLLGVAILVLQAYSRHRWQKLIWAFDIPASEKPKIVIETIEGQETRIYRRPTAGLGAVEAVAQLSTALNASRDGLLRPSPGEEAVVLAFSSEPQADAWCSTAHTVIVGGPKSNHKTEEILRAFGCQPDVAQGTDPDELVQRTAQLLASPGVGRALGVATLGNTLYWFGQAYTGEVTYEVDPVTGQDSYNGHDYGVVLRLPSPNDDRYRTVVVFGSQTFGVGAACTWLVSLRRRAAGRKARSTMAQHRNVAALVRAEVEHGRLGELAVVAIVTLPDELERQHW